VSDLRKRLVAAKLAGTRIATTETASHYVFNSNEAAADAAVAVVMYWLRSYDAEAVLVAHQPMSNNACLCGWAELGRSHPRHMLGALAERLGEAP
jgi:hypothetical protein